MNNTQWWKTLPQLTEKDKKAITDVDERNFLAGPGTFELEFEYQDRMKQDRPLKDAYDTAKKKVQIAEENKINEIINWVKANPNKNFRGEEVHILNGVGNNAKVVGRIDRAIAEKYGYVHETSNVVLVTPDGKALLQLRNKKNFDDHLAMYGGHLGVGESHIHAVVEETKQELGLAELKGKPAFVDYEGYDVWGDNNKERRSWFVKILTRGEYDKILKREREAKALKASKSRAAYKQYLFDIQKHGNGEGEVVGTYEFSFDELSRAGSSKNPESPYENKINRFLKITDTFEGKPVTVGAFFTPDSLDRLLSPENANLWSKIQEVARSEMHKIKMAPDSSGQSSSPVTEQQGQGARVRGQGIANDERRDTSDDKVGGIDMNTIDLNREGAVVDIQFDPAQLQELIESGIDGFAPVIINIVPLPSVLPLLGLEPRKEEEGAELSKVN